MSHDNEKDFYDRHILEPSSSSFTSPYAERIRELERERRERARRREDIERNRMDRYMRRKYLRHIANQQFYKSISMLQSNARDDEEKQPIEDFSLFVYRMTAPDFKDRVKELENKLLRPVSRDGCSEFWPDVSSLICRSFFLTGFSEFLIVTLSHDCLQLTHILTYLPGQHPVHGVSSSYPIIY